MFSPGVLESLEVREICSLGLLCERLRSVDSMDPVGSFVVFGVRMCEGEGQLSVVLEDGKRFFWYRRARSHQIPRHFSPSFLLVFCYF